MATKPRKTRKTPPTITERLMALSPEDRSQRLPKWTPEETLMVLELMRQLVATSEDAADVESANLVIDHICSGRLSRQDKLFAMLAYGVNS